MKNIYRASNFESKIQKFWKENEYFINNKESEKTFSIILPPPNVTGNLHLGHAWDAYYPDLLIRYKRLKGYKAIWYPGTDHAGIATQIKVAQKLKEEFNKEITDISRSEFIKLTWDWKEDFENNIKSQWAKLGIALDYKNLKFTLDNDVNELVTKTFIKFYNDGLIYQDERLVNWDNKLQTAISDIEVIKKANKANLYFLKYKVKDSNDSIIVATTRPETMFGDVAIFINPKDKRYKKYHNKFVINPANNQELPILLDKEIDIEYGTGIMKATPAHDFFDYKLAKDHKLRFINVFTNDGKINENAPKKFQNLSIFKAREKLLADFKLEGIIEKIEQIDNFIPVSSRTDEIIEPRISKQWFLKTSKLAKDVKKYQNQENKKILFYPQKFENDFLNWILKMEDWCISRQIIWGHRLPVFEKDGKIIVAKKSPGFDWIQSNDVLDTWFSSSLWPIVFYDKNVAKLSDNPDFLTDSLFTGYDIILFWVSRMIMQSLYLKNKAPFKNVIIHGLIRDKNGLKMSKSLNNGINPISVIDKWGSDSLRLFLLGNSTPGNDLKYDESKVNRYWTVCNKLFNIYQFIDKYYDLEEFTYEENFWKKDLSDVDKYILSKLDRIIVLIEENVEKYNLSFLIGEMINFINEDFSSIYLEIAKKINNKEQKQSLMNIFVRVLILFHPFIPFLTEEIYQNFSNKFNLEKSILLEKFPENSKIKFDNRISILLDLIKTTRLIHSETNYKYLSLLNLYLSNLSKEDEIFYNKYLNIFNSALNKKDVNIKKFNGVKVTLQAGMIYYIFEEGKLIDYKILNGEAISKYKFEYERAAKILDNKNNIKNEDLIEREYEKKEFYNKLLKILNDEN